jgi:SRR1
VRTLLFSIKVAYIYLFFRRIEQIEVDLENSDFFENAHKLIEKAINQRDIEEIICLGIGRVSECSIAKHQLAFIAIIRKKFNIQKVQFFDPILNDGDRDILKRLDFVISSENKEGKYSVTSPTLFYLPHCPKQITNNLLYTNWSAESLKNIILICNSFKQIIESTPERLLRPNAHYLLELSNRVTEFEIENNFRFTDIFNDFSIHSFQANKLADVPWNNRPEPKYSLEEIEFISNGSNQDTSCNSK